MGSEFGQQKLCPIGLMSNIAIPDEHYTASGGASIDGAGWAEPSHFGPYLVFVLRIHLIYLTH